MGKIYIGFSYPREFKIGAKAIVWWTGASYSHVYLRFAYSDSKDAIFHAAHGMVHFRSVSNFIRDNVSVKEYEVELSAEQHEAFFDECMELAGEDYSTMELVKIFVADLAFWTLKKEIHFKDSKGYICSELVGFLLRNKLQLEFSKPTFLLKPNDIDFALSLKYRAKYG